MFTRPTLLVVLIALIVSGTQFGTRAQKNPTDLIAQDRPLALSTARSKRSDGKTELKLTGRYKRADKVVELRGLTIKGARRKVAVKHKPKQSSPVSTSAAITRFAPTVQDQLPVYDGGRDPGYDYYYTEGEMVQSNGTVLVSSAYEYDSGTDENSFTLTVAGVTFSVDLNTYELMQRLLTNRPRKLLRG